MTKIKIYNEKELQQMRETDKTFIDNYYDNKEYAMRIHPLRVLFFEITSRCNARCEHCGSSCGDFIPKDEITGDEVRKVLREIYDKNYDTRKVMLNITGGEPLLRKDLFELMAYARSLGYSWGITSNGMLIDEKIVQKMAETEMYSVSISIDGMKETHESFRKVKGSWEKIIKGLKLMMDCPTIKIVQVTTCVCKKNIDELEELYNFLVDLGIKYWRLMEVDPIGRAKDNDELLINPEETERMFNFVAEKQRDGKMVVEYGCSHFLGMDVEPVIRQKPFICYTGITVGSVLSNGDIFVCPDVERRPELIQGNIRKDSFTEVWETKFKPFRTLDRTSNEKCLNCADWKLCGGDAFHTWDFDENKPRLCHYEFFDREKRAKETIDKIKKELQKEKKTTKRKTTKK